MKRGLSYLPDESVYPSLGLDVLEPSDQIDPHYSPKMNNFDVVKGILTKRKGYFTLGGTLTDPILGVVEYESLTGVKTLLAFTTKKQYKLDYSDATSPTWVNITYQVTSADVNWTGAESDGFDYVIASGTDSMGTYVKWIIITNGVDVPRYWDGATSKFVLYAPDYTSFTTCKALRMFFNHLILVNVTKGSNNGQMIAWSDAQSLTQFNTGLSGEAVIPGVKGSFVRAEQLGDRMVLYSTNSMCTMTYVGGTDIYSVELVGDETRLLSPKSIANLGAFHMFLSQENVFLFDGSRLMRTMGDKIYRQYREEVDVANAYQAFAFPDFARQQAYFVIPTGGVHAIYKLDYDLSDIASSKWSRHQYADRPLCMGFYTRTFDLLFDSILCQNLDWSDADFDWSAGATKIGFPLRVFGTSGGRVMQADDTVGNDNGTGISAYADTVDFVVPQGFLSENARWLEIEADLQGTSCIVSYSPDKGVTYIPVDTIALGGSFEKYELQIDGYSPTLRVRFENNDTLGSLYRRWVRVWLRPGGPT